MVKRVHIISLGFVLSLALFLTGTFGLSPLKAFASEKTPSPIEVKIKKTNIEADVASNTGGLGSIRITEIEDRKAQHALVNANGEFLFPYKDSTLYTSRYVYSDGIVLEVNPIESKYTSGRNIYDLNGNPPFETPYTLSDYHFEEEDDESLVSSSRSLEFYYLTPFNDGVALARESLYVSLQWKGAGGGVENARYHLLNKDGKIVHTFSDEAASDLSQAFHWTVIPGSHSYEWPSEGLLEITVKEDYGSGDQKSYYMDYEENKKIVLPGYIVGRRFTDGLALVNDGKGKISFIDKTGKDVLLLNSYDSAYSFDNGLARVIKNGKVGCINTKGNVVIPLEYDDIFGSGHGLVSVGKNGKYGLVDYQNRVVLPLEYDDISAFYQGVAFAVKDRTLYIITADTAEYVAQNPLSELGVPDPGVMAKIDISNWNVSGIRDLTYTGAALQQKDIHVFNNDEYADFTVQYKNNVNAGTATVITTGKGKYTGSKTVNFTITKAKNPLKIKVSKKDYKRIKLKKAVSFRIGVSKAQGKVNYTLDKKAKKVKIKVSKKGKVTIPKKCKRGTYKITVKAAGNKNYKAAKKTVTIKIK